MNIKEVYNASKDKIIVGCVIIVVCLVFSLRSCGNDVSNLSDGFSDVDRGLTDSIRGQQATTCQLRIINEGLRNAETEIGVSEVTVIHVSKSLTDSLGILRRDAEIIARDSAIFEKVRSQGKVKD